ncbi:MAG: hypothetical protein IJM63_12865 [Solobacterium sp.]|nr:hypothetical protein [Solobacterium sp.]
MRSVSATNLKYAKVWFLITLLSAIAAFVYELFSFGVYSVFMLSFPLVPLLLGVFPCLITKADMGRWYNDGVLFTMSGFALLGVLEIYGTFSSGPLLMIAAGGLLMLKGIADRFKEMMEHQPSGIH